MDILIIFGLILLNGVFAMSEIAVVSSRQIRLQQAVDNGSEGAKVALQLANDPSRFLSTIQVGITLIGILAGAYGEASIARQLEAMLVTVEPLEPYAKPLALTIMVALITYFSLIFGELVPKRLALLNPEGIAKVLSQPMNVLSRIARPLVWLLGISTEFMLRLLRAKRADEQPMVEEEIRSLMQQGTEAGIMDETEQAMVKNVLRLDDQRVGNIMTLRKDLYYVDLKDSFKENRRKIASSPHSRIPVCKGGIDNIVGVVYAKDVLNKVMSAEEPDLAALVKTPLFIPRYATALQLLKQFKQSKSHIAIVVDEHGQTSGLASLNDVLEAIVGDLPADDEEYDPDFVERENGTWLVSGRVDISAFKDHFDIRKLPEEEYGNYHTLGGLVLNVLGHLPREADVMSIGDLAIEVVDMDGNRVDKLLISNKQATASVSAAASAPAADKSDAMASPGVNEEKA
tara:strand:- start:123936 stop:125309 length:1374 start_codon:yes stop_codon:yes gene_type:complete